MSCRAIVPWLDARALGTERRCVEAFMGAAAGQRDEANWRGGV